MISLKAECQNCGFKRHGIRVDEKIGVFIGDVDFLFSHLKKHRDHVIWLTSWNLDLVGEFPIENRTLEYILKYDSYGNIDVKKIEHR